MASSIPSLRVAGFLVVACVFAVGVGAQPPATQPPPPQAPASQKAVPKIKTAAAIPIPSVEGKDNFEAYCAVCHGKDAKGDGPAAPAMKVMVPNLTTYAARHNGKFEGLRVEYIIRGTGKTPTPAHGVETMPIWGEVFRSEDRSTSALRIKNLVDYVQSIQVRPGS